jgi:drug/metabolite transporter (DMT)-like permease
MNRIRLKTRIVGTVVVLSNVLGNYFLSLGLKRHGPLVTLSPLPYVEALFSPWVTLGVSLLILWLLSRMALLSWTDLSYVLPVTSIGYVLTALAGRFFLAEQVSWQRWAGTLLIVAGVVLVGRTSPATHQEAQP